MNETRLLFPQTAQMLCINAHTSSYMKLLPSALIEKSKAVIQLLDRKDREEMLNESENIWNYMRD
jgi:hypothetical protein